MSSPVKLLQIPSDDQYRLINKFASINPMVNLKDKIILFIGPITTCEAGESSENNTTMRLMFVSTALRGICKRKAQ